MCTALYFYYFVLLGDFHLALWTSLTLRNYEDLLNTEQIYSIIALAAIANNLFNIASRAFMKLETIDTVISNLFVNKSHKKLSLFNFVLQKKNYHQLSLVIFSKYAPKDSTQLSIQCYSCLDSFPAW